MQFAEASFQAVFVLPKANKIKQSICKKEYYILFYSFYILRSIW